MPAKFYFWEPPCSNSEFERPAPLLIGMSIFNQVFSLMIHPDENIHSLADWELQFAREGSTIWSSGEKIPVDVLLKNIHNLEKRKIDNSHQFLVKFNNKPTIKWDKELFLYRFVVDGEHCIRHQSDHDIMSQIYSAYL
jgi:hypothetical protein